MEWKRASEIFNDPKVFHGGITPDDIQQGALGDCYYLSALSSLAEHPENIADLFHTKEVNAAGIYLMIFYINGIRTPVIVDDYLPCKNGRLAFARSVGEELWVCLLEKAWAKLYGSYARMEGGDPGFALSHLTGKPADTFWHDDVKDKDEFWAKIKLADAKKYQMTAGS